MWREEQVFSTQLSKGSYVPQRWGRTHTPQFLQFGLFADSVMCSFALTVQLSFFSLGFFLSFRHLLHFCNDFRFIVRCHTRLNSSSCQFFWPLIFSTVTHQVQQVMQSCFESWECKCRSKNSLLFVFLYISICFALFLYSSWLFRRICIYLFIGKTPLENKVALNSLKCLLIYIENWQKYC